MYGPTKSEPLRSRKNASCLGRMFRFVLRATDLLSLAALVLASVGSLLRFDRFLIGMPLTYSPRVLWLGVAAVLAVFYLYLRRFKRFALIALLSVLLCHDASWGIKKRPSNRPGPVITLLSFNTHYAVGEDIATLCTEHDVDILCMQENFTSRGKRRDFMRSLPEYRFFTGSLESAFRARPHWHRSCMIGVRTSLLEQTREPTVASAITGFRTFAVKLDLIHGPLQLINVHTRKPVSAKQSTIRDCVQDNLRMMRQHREEYDLLRSWLEQNVDEATPVIIAGDFNAPGNARNLRFPGFKHAQFECGRGLHLTFPASFPILGIDHVLGNEAIAFRSCKMLDTGVSDHRAMLVRFSLPE